MNLEVLNLSKINKNEWLVDARTRNLHTFEEVFKISQILIWSIIIYQGGIPNTVIIGQYWMEGSLICFLFIGIERKGIHNTFTIDLRVTPNSFPPQVKSSRFK